MSSRRALPFITTGVFFLFALTGILHHEMWRDEYQAWLVARDAQTIGQLLANLTYEGNPALWHLLLFGLTRFTHDAAWMQMLHILISTASVFLLNRYAPFPLLWKVLLSFGYYSLFELNLISRSYGLGFLLVLVICVLYEQRWQRATSIATILCLLANTHVFGLMLSACFAGILVLDYALARRRGEAPGISAATLTLCAAIVAAGWLASYLQIRAEPDNTFPIDYAQGAFQWPRARYALARIVTGYFALPRLDTAHFWNTSVFEPPLAPGHVFTTMPPIWPALVLAVFALHFRRRPLVCLLYVLGTLGLVGFFYYSMCVSQRHVAHLFILLVSAMWLMGDSGPVPLDSGWRRRLTGLGEAAGQYLFTLILAVSFVGGVGAYLADLRAPFSAGSEAADLLRQDGLADAEIIGVSDFLMSPIAARLDRQLYYPQRQAHGSFTIWDGRRQDKILFAEIAAQIEALHQQGNKPMVYITEVPLKIEGMELWEARLNDTLHVRLLHVAGPGIVEDERYFIYLVEERPPETGDAVISGRSIGE